MGCDFLFDMSKFKFHVMSPGLHTGLLYIRYTLDEEDNGRIRSTLRGEKKRSINVYVSGIRLLGNRPLLLYVYLLLVICSLYHLPCYFGFQIILKYIYSLFLLHC